MRIKNASLIPWIAVSAAVALLLPWMAVTFAKGDAGMAACFLLFYAVNPFYAVIVGSYAGRDSMRLWSLPVIFAGMFLSGVWILFDMGEPDFMIYAAVYLVLGICAMAVSMLICKRCSAGL